MAVCSTADKTNHSTGVEDSLELSRMFVLQTCDSSELGIVNRLFCALSIAKSSVSNFFDTAERSTTKNRFIELDYKYTNDAQVRLSALKFFKNIDSFPKSSDFRDKQLEPEYYALLSRVSSDLIADESVGLKKTITALQINVREFEKAPDDFLLKPVDEQTHQGAGYPLIDIYDSIQTSLISLENSFQVLSVNDRRIVETEKKKFLTLLSKKLSQKEYYCPCRESLLEKVRSLSQDAIRELISNSKNSEVFNAVLLCKYLKVEQQLKQESFFSCLEQFLYDCAYNRGFSKKDSYLIQSILDELKQLIKSSNTSIEFRQKLVMIFESLPKKHEDDLYSDLTMSFFLEGCWGFSLGELLTLKEELISKGSHTPQFDSYLFDTIEPRMDSREELVDDRGIFPDILYNHLNNLGFLEHASTYLSLSEKRWIVNKCLRPTIRERGLNYLTNEMTSLIPVLSMPLLTFLVNSQENMKELLESNLIFNEEFIRQRSPGALIAIRNLCDELGVDVPQDSALATEVAKLQGELNSEDDAIGHDLEEVIPGDAFL